MRIFAASFCALLLGATALAADATEGIVQAASAYVKTQTGITDPVVKVEKVAGDFARVQVSSKAAGSDPAIAFLRVVKGKWKVLTLGTSFEPDELKRLKIPAALQP